MLQAIFNSEKNVFKINLAFGFILSNVDTGEKRYHYPTQNGSIFDQPLVVADEADLRKSAAVRGRDRLVRVRQTRESQQQVAHRLAHQRGLPLVPNGGETYRPWQDRRPVAQVVARVSRSGCTGKRPVDW